MVGGCMYVLSIYPPSTSGTLGGVEPSLAPTVMASTPYLHRPIYVAYIRSENSGKLMDFMACFVARSRHSFRIGMIERVIPGTSR